MEKEDDNDEKPEKCRVDEDVQSSENIRGTVVMGLEKKSSQIHFYQRQEK